MSPSRITPAVPSVQRLATTAARRRWGWLETCAVLAGLSLIGQLTAPSAYRVWREWPEAGHWPMPGTRTAATAVIDTPSGYSEVVQYWLYLPKDYEKHGSWPLVVYLHGSGNRGDDLSALGDAGPFRHIASGNQLPCIVVAPQCRAERRWEPELLLSFLDRLQACYMLDRNRIAITGYSMGGMGTFALAAAAPDRFASAVPVAGGGDTQTAQSLAQLPIWCFHGDHDRPEASIEMVRAIEAAGGKPRLTVLENQGHDIDALVYAREDLYEWILAQQREKPQGTD